MKLTFLTSLTIFILFLIIILILKLLVMTILQCLKTILIVYTDFILSWRSQKMLSGILSITRRFRQMLCIFLLIFFCRNISRRFIASTSSLNQLKKISALLYNSFLSMLIGFLKRFWRFPKQNLCYIIIAWSEANLY